MPHDDLQQCFEIVEDERFDRATVEHVKDFLRHLSVERGLSHHTVRAYATDLRGYLDWAARAQIDPINLNHRRFRRYLADLEAGGYERKTMSRHLSAVRTFFAYLNSTGVTAANPAAAVATPKSGRALPRKTSASDIEALLSVCETDDPVGRRDQAFLELLYASGARISEVAGLTVTDIDFSERTVRLFGKGSKERITPLYDMALEALRSYIGVARPRLLGDEPQDALFISTRGKPMSADSLRKVFKRRAAQAGLDPSLHPHDMRHAFATDLLEGGADMRSVQEMLGHASLSTTQVYTHLSLEHMKDVLKTAHPRS